MGSLDDDPDNAAEEIFSTAQDLASIRAGILEASQAAQIALKISR